jgi:N-acetyl-anhydromuramyl-L-alanine amidase AmpD
MDVTAEQIRGWHIERGWNDIGYHWLIRRDGTLEKGRDESVVGAHASGFNSSSIGVALAGGVDSKMDAESNFTQAQYEAMFALKSDFDTRYKDAKHCGHNELSSKECPSLNIKCLFGV